MDRAHTGRTARLYLFAVSSARIERAVPTRLTDSEERSEIRLFARIPFEPSNDQVRRAPSPNEPSHKIQ